MGESILSAGIGEGLGTPETVGGDITLNATESIKIAGTGSNVRNLVGLGSLGNGGNITIDSGSLSLQNGAEVIASTSGLGNAGNVNVNVTDAVDIAGRNSAILSSVPTGTVGNGGNIDILAATLSLVDGAQVTASTFGQGNAGAIKVNATDFSTVSGNNSNFNSDFSVSSQSTTGTAGDIILTSPIITLDNTGTLNAQSVSGNGGDINLQTDLLLLRRGAQISTTAGTAQVGGDGGNISINTSGILIAVKPVPEPTLPLSVFALTAFYAAWKLKRKQEQTHELKA